MNEVSSTLALGIKIGRTKVQVGIRSANRKLLMHPIQRQLIRENDANGIPRWVFGEADWDSFISISNFIPPNTIEYDGSLLVNPQNNNTTACISLSL